MSTNPINSLTADQISGNFLLDCVSKLDTTVATLDNETFVNDTDNIYVSSTSSSTYDDTGTFLLLLGTNCEINETNNIIVGCNSDIGFSESVLNIGHESDVVGSETHAITNCINIGHDTDISNPADAGPLEDIVNIGNNNDLNNASHVITIGNDLGHGGLLNDNIIISSHTIDTTGDHFPAPGSIILQSTASTVAEEGGRPPALPRFSVLGDSLLNLRGENVNSIFDGNVDFVMGNINGFIRLKYKNAPLLIPCILDSELNADVANPQNVDEFG